VGEQRGWTDVHDKAAAVISRLLHEIKGKGTGKCDKAVVARLGHNEHGLNIGFDTRAT
jgi:hypothetical protein